VVFDLDETLVRVQQTDFVSGADFVVTIADKVKGEKFVTFYIPKSPQIYIKFRPFLRQVLELLRNHYEIILFTAASEQYANIVLETFEGGLLFDHILSRKQCLRIVS
jgi:TFIIF-interacting CTD phosphatase-like protein